MSGEATRNGGPMMERALQRLSDQELLDLVTLSFLEMQRRGIVGAETETSIEELQQRIAKREART